MLSVQVWRSTSSEMIGFEKKVLENGLKVIVHEDRQTPLVAMNVVYNAGSKYENEGLTGIAHLMEHLMFAGSMNIPDYDTPLQMAGGDNNAYTNNDVADFYLTIPAENIETALWLESDRMIKPKVTRRSLEIQKKVVSEEFSQRYLNQPYGDAMHLLRKEAYIVHPYRWPAIGMELSHIDRIELNDISDFIRRHYTPSNAILTLAGNIETPMAFDLVDKWFGDINGLPGNKNPVMPEPVQQKARRISVERDVPSCMIYKAWHACARNEDDFRVLDLMTDILSGGESGRLYEILVREKKIFSEINAYLTGDLEPGLIVCYGKVMDGIVLEKAEEELQAVIRRLTVNEPRENEMEKVKNRFESTTRMSNISVLSKVLNLSGYELAGDANLINRETERYFEITSGQVLKTAREYLMDENCTTLLYRSANR
ncbi:MAG TPA: pitrilysin family protein [Bacteroidales bacterium]|nr:pitrilysin family protein [Bacteroidales bacterium]